MSTSMMVYLNYISNWHEASDDEIKAVLDEMDAYTKLDIKQTESLAAVKTEFDDLRDKARVVSAMTVAKDATNIAADSAAIGALFSFGFGFAAFVVLEVAELIENGVISAHAKELNEKLATVDEDIAAKISGNTKTFIDMYKKNNPILNSKATGVDSSHARGMLFQFMAQAKLAHDGELTVDIFRQEAAIARELFNSDQIDKVYEAFDVLVDSPQSNDDLKAFIGTLKGFPVPDFGITRFILASSIVVVGKYQGMSKKRLVEVARNQGVDDISITSKEALVNMDVIGKVAAVAAIAMTVVQIVFAVLDMINVVEQTEALLSALDTCQTNYENYFKLIGESAKAFNEVFAGVATR